jgi:CHAT domain-containing protein
LSFVFNGALTSLPPQLLVTSDPTGKALKDVDWLLRTHAVTVLPSVASLKVLRSKSTLADAAKPLIGFADPVLDPQRMQQSTRLTTALPPLPETADELKEVAASVHANPADVILGPDATETRVKQESSINTASSTLPPTACSPAMLRILPSSTSSRRWCYRCPSIRPSSTTAF